MKKKKGFTLIELLVVISIIAMLLAILMPALGKVKKLAQRLVCGTNVKGLGTACFVYANDYDDDFPIAGGTGGGSGAKVWATQTGNWAVTGQVNRGQVTVAASLYMLVREADVGMGSFICTASDDTEFQLSDEPAEGSGVDDPSQLDPTQVWDFGSSPQDNQSYAYHAPYESTTENPARPISGTSNSAMAVIADQNPFMDNRMTQGGGSADSWVDNADLIDMNASDSNWKKQIGNSASHERSGQNVLFVDGHVSFEKSADVANRDDNIYTIYRGPGPYSEEDRRVGEIKTEVGIPFAKTSTDSILVNDESCK